MRANDKIKTDLLAGKQVKRNFHSPHPEFEIHIIINPIKDDSEQVTKCTLSGYAIEKANGAIVPYTYVRPLICKDINNVQVDIKTIINKITAKIPSETIDAKHTVRKKTDNKIFDIIKSVKDDVLSHKFDNMGIRTREQAYKYLLNSVAREMDKIDGPIYEEDMNNIVKKLVHRAATSGKGKRPQNGEIEKNYAASRNGVMDRLSRARDIYNYVRETHPVFNLPEVEFPIEARIPATRREQLKYLPDAVRVKLAKLIERDAENGVECAFGAGSMFHAGLRTAEAVAAIMKDFEFLCSSNYGRYFVQYQIIAGKRDPLLKTSNAYRYVAIVSAMCDLVRKKSKKLIGLGFAADEISEMPYVAAKDDLHKFLDPQELSAYVVKLLERAGCTAAFLTEAEQLMYEEPEYDDNGKPIYDLAAYILRRDWCSRACNVCGLQPWEVDYLLGHANKSNAKRDFGNPDRVNEIARKLERYVCDPEHTTNPAFRPIPIEGNTDYSLVGNEVYRFVTKQKTTIEIDLLTMEPNNPIYIEYKGKLYSYYRRTPEDQKSDRFNRPTIGVIHDMDYYSVILAELDETSLTQVAGRSEEANVTTVEENNDWNQSGEQLTFWTLVGEED